MKNTELTIDFMDHVRDYIIKYNLYNVTPNTKYSLNEILEVIKYILITGSSWRSLDLGVFKNSYKWQSIYYHYSKFCTYNIFQNVYTNLLSHYFKKNKSGKLKYLSVDTSLIKNECSSDANYGYNKKKKVCKLSLIVDSNGIPISVLLAKGNANDGKIMLDNMEDMLVCVDYNNKKKNNKHKRYMMGDKIYDTEEVRNKIKDNNITPIIAANKRNTKDKEKLNMKKLSKNHKKIYRKRIKVENSFSWIFKNRRTNRRWDKHCSTYLGFVYFALINIISKRI